MLVLQKLRTVKGKSVTNLRYDASWQTNMADLRMTVQGNTSDSRGSCKGASHHTKLISLQALVAIMRGSLGGPLPLRYLAAPPAYIVDNFQATMFQTII